MLPSPDTPPNETGTLAAVQDNSTPWIASGLTIFGAFLILISIHPGCLGPDLTAPGVTCIVVSCLLAVTSRRPALVLVPIILGVATLAMAAFAPPPRRNSNEFAAVSNLRTINTAEVTYLSSAGRYGALTDLIDASLLDDTFTGTKAGYKYTVTLDATGYTATALPALKENGRYGYYSVPDAVVRYSTNASLAPRGQSGRSVQE